MSVLLSPHKYKRLPALPSAAFPDSRASHTHIFGVSHKPQTLSLSSNIGSQFILGEDNAEQRDAKEFIYNQGYGPVYGARPLKRAIQHLLLDPLRLDVLEGKFVDGDVI